MYQVECLYYETIHNSHSACWRPHHSAMVRIIKPLQQLHTGALPTTAASHKGQRLARFHRHIQPIQDLDVWPGGVGELTVDEFNVPLEVILETRRTEEGGGGKSTKVTVGFSVC